MPYIGPYGELDANSLDSANDKVYTINADEIRDDVFGFEIGDWVYSFYFFRTDCSASDLVTNQETTSLIEVNNAITEERVCLNLTSYHCRNYPEDGKHCSGQEVPLYDIFKGWP